MASSARLTRNGPPGKEREIPGKEGGAGDDDGGREAGEDLGRDGGEVDGEDVGMEGGREDTSW